MLKNLVLLNLRVPCPPCNILLVYSSPCQVLLSLSLSRSRSRSRSLSLSRSRWWEVWVFNFIACRWRSGFKEAENSVRMRDILLEEEERSQLGRLQSSSIIRRKKVLHSTNPRHRSFWWIDCRAGRSFPRYLYLSSKWCCLFWFLKWSPRRPIKDYQAIMATWITPRITLSAYIWSSSGDCPSHGQARPLLKLIWWGSQSAQACHSSVKSEFQWWVQQNFFF